MRSQERCLADRSLDPADRRLQAKLADAPSETGPEVMFVTSPVELHPDHRALALALQRTLRRWSLLGGRRRQPAWVAAYEVGTVLRPNLLVDGDPGWEAKRRAGACYASQLEVPRLRRSDGGARDVALPHPGRVRAGRGVSPAAVRTVVRRSERAWAAGMGCPEGVVRVRG